MFFLVYDNMGYYVKLSNLFAHMLWSSIRCYQEYDPQKKIDNAPNYQFLDAPPW